ncbi:MAG TPA: DUF3883 domain-containing protein [Chthoniobacterales bacterium]|nr:DUF3883 domain-containing protein [Chthoniobacterales bacterium]
MPANWLREEVEAVVADYFAMLTMELRGEPFNKAERNRNLQLMLDDRPRGSVERKHQNISAILIELGYPYIDGYKPLGNYQRLLAEVVAERLSAAANLNATVAAAVEAPLLPPPVFDDILGIEVPRPHSEEPTARVREEPSSAQPPVRRNYLEIEARSRSLGRAGEDLVLRFEHERLWRAGERRLADRIEHISQTLGDHLGYDIHSFEIDGRERLIEVKTTRFGALTPFFASRNEVEFSAARDPDYHLYRLFAFGKSPKLFTLLGALQTTSRLTAVTFSAIPK